MRSSVRQGSGIRRLSYVFYIFDKYVLILTYSVSAYVNKQ